MKGIGPADPGQAPRIGRPHRCLPSGTTRATCSHWSRRHDPQAGNWRGGRSTTRPSPFARTRWESGRGDKIPLLNAIISRVPASAEGGSSSSDDDVDSRAETLVDLVDLCAEGGFDLAQPARSRRQLAYQYNVAHPITIGASDLPCADDDVRRERASRRRRPALVASHRAVPGIARDGVGRSSSTGTSCCEDGCRLGIIDAVRVAHRGEPGRDYDFEREVERMHAELARPRVRGLGGRAENARRLAAVASRTTVAERSRGTRSVHPVAVRHRDDVRMARSARCRAARSLAEQADREFDVVVRR